MSPPVILPSQSGRFFKPQFVCRVISNSTVVGRHRDGIEHRTIVLTVRDPWLRCGIEVGLVESIKNGVRLREIFRITSVVCGAKRVR